MTQQHHPEQPPLWEVMRSAYDNAPILPDDADAFFRTGLNGYSEVILAVRDWLKVELPEGGAWHALLTAEAGRALEDGESGMTQKKSLAELAIEEWGLLKEGLYRHDIVIDRGNIEAALERLKELEPQQSPALSGDGGMTAMEESSSSPVTKAVLTAIREVSPAPADEIAAITLRAVVDELVKDAPSFKTRDEELFVRRERIRIYRTILNTAKELA